MKKRIERKEERELDDELNQVGDHISDRHDKSRKVNFPKNTDIGTEGSSAFVQAGGKIVPHHNARKVKEKRRQGISGNLCNFSEDDGINQS